jgi:hypothetical protein
MAEKEAGLMHKYLETYDDLQKEDFVSRRTASKPLYDYFQRLLLEIGVRLCDYKRERFSNFHLKTRWTEIKKAVSQIDEKATNNWDNIIFLINNIREKVEHDDDYDPPIKDLEKVREKAPEFHKWVINAGKRYYQESESFSLLQSFRYRLFEYKNYAEWILEEYGENPHIASEYGYIDKFKDVTYKNLPDIIEQTEKRSKEIDNIKDITKDDFDLLIGLVEFIAEFRCRESNLISKAICPKCGGKITDTGQYVGGGSEEPPSGVYRRVGCEKCDYILHEETISL